jgi:hypothetical protein
MTLTSRSRARPSGVGSKSAGSIAAAAFTDLAVAGAEGVIHGLAPEGFDVVVDATGCRCHY